jgi:nucleotide-binding universal stress UspA family protein
MFKKILVPLDGSSMAEAVLPYVRRMAVEDGAEVELLTVTMLPMPAYPVDAPLDFDMVIKQQQEASNAYLKKVMADLGHDGIKVTPLVAEGPVADEILTYAESTGADLIAMSTHGRSGLSRWLMGSVADKVLHGAKVPVLLIRPDEAKKS